jgi:carotenoid cleavage dioxygenase-like enzyme
VYWAYYSSCYLFLRFFAHRQVYITFLSFISFFQVEGEIPKELEGTLFRNGPALFEYGASRLNQPFDGDGMVCRFAFKDGKVHFRNR